MFPNLSFSFDIQSSILLQKDLFYLIVCKYVPINACFLGEQKSMLYPRARVSGNCEQREDEGGTKLGYY